MTLCYENTLTVVIFNQNIRTLSLVPILVYPVLSFPYTVTRVSREPCRVGSVGSVSASRTVGREFASQPGHTKDHHKYGTNCFPAWHAMRQGRSLTVQSDCLKGRVVCGTVYGDMYLKDLHGSIVRVGYRIPVSDFYLVLHGLRCRKSTIMD